MEALPQIAIGKNTGLKKLLKTLSTGNDTGFRTFLRRHYVELDNSIFEEIEQKKQNLVDQLKNEGDEEIPQEIKDNAVTIVYTYLCAAIESTWMKYGADIAKKPISYTSRIIKRNKNLVQKELVETINKNFKDLDDFTSSIIPDIEAEAVLQDAFRSE